MNRNQARAQKLLEEYKALSRLSHLRPSDELVIAGYDLADRCVRAGVPREKIEAWASRIAREHKEKWGKGVRR